MNHALGHQAPARAFRGQEALRARGAATDRSENFPRREESTRGRQVSNHKYLYIVGGRQRRTFRQFREWQSYDRARILRLDRRTMAISECVSYVSPAEVCHEQTPAVVFKAASLVEDRLYACTETEVLIYRLPGFDRIGYLSHRNFNDVHHVVPTREGTLLVALTGLDMVGEYDLDGRALRHWTVVDEKPWERFSPDIDYRKIPTTKPHRSHPNYVFTIGEDIWVTRFEQSDARCLTRKEKPIDLGSHRVHDGIFHEGYLYFTQVTGHILKVDPNTLQVVEDIDLNLVEPRRPQELGWCRGLAFEGDEVWVGFTRIRHTKIRENLSFLKHGFERVGAYNTLPTRVACYNIPQRRLLHEVNLEDLRLNAVFSLHLTHLG